MSSMTRIEEKEGEAKTAATAAATAISISAGGQNLGMGAMGSFQSGN